MNQKLIILADKTNNLYRLTTDEYNKSFSEYINKAYKKSISTTMRTIDTKAEVIAQD